MHHGRRNTKIIFLLEGWQTKLWMYWIFAKIFERNNYYCITYAYDKGVLSPDTFQTVQNITIIADDILNKIETLKKEGYRNFSIFGTSLGALIALFVADKSKDVSKIILNMTGADIAEAIWSWDSVNPHFKKSLLEQSYTLEKLRNVWKPISPMHNIQHLKNKKILIFLSKNDELIPYHLGEKLLQEFERRKYDYKVIVNHHFKHFFTGVINLCNSKEYLGFLKK